LTIRAADDILILLQNGTFCPISACPMSGIYASLRQAQILILPRRINPRNIQYIPVVEPDLKFGRLPPFKVRDLRIELEPRLNIKKGLTGQAKITIFQRYHFILKRYQFI